MPIPGSAAHLAGLQELLGATANTGSRQGMCGRREGRKVFVAPAVVLAVLVLVLGVKGLGLCHTWCHLSPLGQLLPH